ncbi:unnamed protein product [marine sediment metagenome]|uniref:Uncharacterized protein n=1 Tax=marine sediment metagenome TaxID=412755 RepID=X1N4Q9_9ZZZZ
MPKKGARPRDIPATPHYIYRDRGWAGYKDWLGTRVKKRKATSKRKFRSIQSLHNPRDSG